MNARNAKADFRAPYQVRRYGFFLNGPLIRNRWGYFFNFDRNEQDENEFINATVLNPVTLEPEAFLLTALTPSRNKNFEIRSDYLATSKHTVGVGYRFSTNQQLNEGLGEFDLPERAYRRSTRDDNLRLSLTSIATEHAVNELRIQLSRRTTNTQAISAETAVQVTQAFSSGGNQNNLFSRRSEDNLDFTDNLTYSYKTHSFKFGVRAEGARLTTIDRQNFGGTFTFGSDFERNAQGIPIDEAGNPAIDGQTVAVPISGLELYRRVLQDRPGYRPSQFTINRGDPFIGFSQWEMGWFAQDDWRVSPQLTLSYGVRHEFQTHLQDKLNFAPRLGIAYQPGKTPAME